MTKEEIVKRDIILGASDLFKEYGYNKSTMEDIARKVGKGKSTVYYYFSSKEEVFYAVVDNDMNNLYSSIDAEIIKYDNTEDKLKAMVNILACSLEDKTTLFSIVNGSMDANVLRLASNRIRIIYGERQYGIIHDIISYGVSSGELSVMTDKELDLTINMFNGSIRGIVVDLYNHDKDIKYTISMLELFVEIVMCKLIK